MSQDGNNVAVSTEQVRNAISSLVDREKNMLTNLDGVSSAIMTGAEYLAILKDSAQVGTYKELMLNLGKLDHEIRAHQAVLQGLAQTYQGSLSDTDFRGLLDQGLADRLQREPYKPQADKRFNDFLEVVGGEQGPGAGGADEELGDDEDLMMEEDRGRSWVNDKCPLSLRDVMELTRPVKDPVGYVYEHESIMEFLRSRPAGVRKHPVAGVQAPLTAADLRPAEDVLRAKRRQRLLKAMGGGGGSGEGNDSREGEEIIDV